MYNFPVTRKIMPSKELTQQTHNSYHCRNIALQLGNEESLLVVIVTKR